MKAGSTSLQGLEIGIGPGYDLPSGEAIQVYSTKPLPPVPRASSITPMHPEDVPMALALRGQQSPCTCTCSHHHRQSQMPSYPLSSLPGPHGHLYVPARTFTPRQPRLSRSSHQLAEDYYDEHLAASQRLQHAVDSGQRARRASMQPAHLQPSLYLQPPPQLQPSEPFQPLHLNSRGRVSPRVPQGKRSMSPWYYGTVAVPPPLEPDLDEASSKASSLESSPSHSDAVWPGHADGTRIRRSNDSKMGDFHGHDESLLFPLPPRDPRHVNWTRKGRTMSEDAVMMPGLGQPVYSTQPARYPPTRQHEPLQASTQWGSPRLHHAFLDAPNIPPRPAPQPPSRVMSTSPALSPRTPPVRPTRSPPMEAGDQLFSPLSQETRLMFESAFDLDSDEEGGDGQHASAEKMRERRGTVRDFFALKSHNSHGAADSNSSGSTSAQTSASSYEKDKAEKPREIVRRRSGVYVKTGGDVKTFMAGARDLAKFWQTPDFASNK